MKAGRLRQRVGAIVGDLLVLCPAQHLKKSLPRHRKGSVRKRLPVVHLRQGVQRKADLHALALGKHQLQQLFLPGHKGHEGIDKDDAVPKISPALQQRTAAHDPVLLVLKLALQQRLIGLVDPGHLPCLLRQLRQAGLAGKKPQLIRQNAGVFKLVNLAQHRPHKGGVFGLAGVQLQLVPHLAQRQAHQNLLGRFGDHLPRHAAAVGKDLVAQPSEAVHLHLLRAVWHKARHRLFHLKGKLLRHNQQHTLFLPCGLRNFLQHGGGFAAAGAAQNE